MAKKKKKQNKGYVFVLILICLFAYYLFENKEEKVENNEPKEEKKVKIIDENSKTRPYAVVINNNHAAWPHYGLNDAYISYEMLAEGGITRIMALFKDQTTNRVGSVRSARPYFLDYALENDAIFVHHGWSEDAKSDITKLNINNINGLYDTKVFFRDTSLNKAYEHTSFTNLEKVKEFAKEKGYDRNVKQTLLKYSVDTIDLSQNENAIKADKIYMKYSNYTDTEYEYDEVNKVYKRSMSNKAHKDGLTGNQYTYKNILITPLKYKTYDTYGRLTLENIGTFNGYYITEGYAVPITFTKTSRSAKTIYKYENGEEIKFNDGNTFIQITPLGAEVEISWFVISI